VTHMDGSKHYVVTLVYEGDADTPEQAAQDCLEWVAMLSADDVLAEVAEACGRCGHPLADHYGDAEPGERCVCTACDLRFE
jgi:hypothetical protein